MAPWLSWLLLGLVAGTLAKFLVPGRDPPGCLVTTALGIAGAFVGGLDVRSVALATFGAILVLLAGRLLLGRIRRRPPRRP